MLPLRPTTLVVVCLLAPLGAASAHPGRGLIVDSRGRVYFLDAIHNRLWRWDATGGLTSLLSGIHSDHLLLGPGDTVYAGHDYYDGLRFRSRWWRVSPSGVVAPADSGAVPVAAPPRAPEEERLARRPGWPWRVMAVAAAPDSAGAVYLLERRGGYQGALGTLFTFSWIATVAGNPRLERLTPDGRLETVVTVGGGWRVGVFWGALIGLSVLVALARRRRAWRGPEPGGSFPG